MDLFHLHHYSRMPGGRFYYHSYKMKNSISLRPTFTGGKITSNTGHIETQLMWCIQVQLISFGAMHLDSLL